MAESWTAILEEAIQACGNNQAKLAGKLDRSPSVVGNWRIGRFKPDYESCLALAEITGRPPDELLRMAGHDPRWLRVVRAADQSPAEKADGEHGKLEAFLAAIETAFRALTEQEWDVREQAGRALFAVPPTNRRREGADNRPGAGIAELDARRRKRGNHKPNPGLTTDYAPAPPRFPFGAHYVNPTIRGVAWTWGRC